MGALQEMSNEEIRGMDKQMLACNVFLQRPRSKA
jgi:hypothetical protein